MLAKKEAVILGHQQAGIQSAYSGSRPSLSPGAGYAVGFLCGGRHLYPGQVLRNLYESLGLSGDDAGTAVSVTLIFLSALLTGLGLFDKLAKHAGAGTLVPITGFANAMVSPALEFKSED